MPDVFTAEKRSLVMSRIRGRGNRDTELRMIALFRAHGIQGWRRDQMLFGKPDFVFRRERLAVFVDGCFWHGCPKPKHAPMPKNRAEWWAAKLARNKARDVLVTRTLRKQGWRVIRVWECDLAPKHWARIARMIARKLSSSGRASARSVHLGVNYKEEPQRRLSRNTI
jgi:DNA mismatch endonuclease, patch repair protein